MKLISLLNHIGRQPVTESYIQEITEDEVLTELGQLMSQYGLLLGNVQEDVNRIHGLYNYIAEAGENDDFDPHGWTKDWELQPEPDQEDINDKCVLSFGDSNVKLRKIGAIYFSLPAGYTCPFAKDCLAFRNRHGKVFKSTGTTVKQKGKFTCYAVGDERIPAVREKRWRNYDLLRAHKNSPEEMADLIDRSLDYHEQEKGAFNLVRIHDAGDFWSQEYFDAWLMVADQRTDTIFYAYTKSLPYWRARKDQIPSNFRLIASAGGKEDHIIDKEGFRQAVVAQTEDEAKKLGLQIDWNDILAAFGEEDFALLLHGVQSKQTGLHRQSEENSRMLKDVAEKKKVNKKALAAAIRNIVRKAQREKMAKRGSELKGIPVVTKDSVGGSAPNVGDGYSFECGATWDQPERGHGYTHY